MNANLFCRFCRGIVAIAVTILPFCMHTTAQKMFYSPQERNLPSEIKTYIIGNVGSNIIIWKYLPQNRRSQILVYDEQMHLLARVKADIFAANDVYQLNFINRQNSFDVIAQVFSNKSFYCQAATFNGKGQLISRVKTLINKDFKKNRYPGGGYTYTASANKKFYTLAKDKLNTVNNTISLDYYLYQTGDTTSGAVHKTLSMPYYRDLSIQFSPLQVDNKGNLFFAQYIMQDNDSASHIILYKAAMAGSDYSSCTTDMYNCRLSNINIKLDNVNRQCIVYALSAGSNRQAGVFSWVVNDNMESKDKTATYTMPAEGALPQVLQNNMLTRDAIALTDNTYTLAITSTGGKQKNMYSNDDNDLLSGYYVNTASYSPGLISAYNPQVPQPAATGKTVSRNTLNHSTDYAYTYTGNNYKPKLIKKRPELPAFTANLTLLRIDNNRHSVLWSKNISSGHDAYAFSFVHKYSLINTGDALYFICRMFFAKDKEAIERIKIDANGNLLVRQVISQNPDYEVLVDRGVQIDNHTMIFPCIFQDKTLAFARYEITGD